MKNTIVSVLMPVYNAEKYLEQSINSILNQTFQDFELIILDDCSTDSSWKIIQDFQKADTRIKIFKNKQNKYIAETRNELLTHATGKYIAWQDADDISLPNRLEEEYDLLEKHPEVGVVGGYLQFFDDTHLKSVRKYATTDTELRKQIFKYSPIAQPAAMIRKEAFDQVGTFNLLYPPAEDLDMWFRIGTLYKFANIPKILIKYRENPNSATFKKLRKIEKDTITIRKKYFNSPAYPANFIDLLYNILQYLSIYLIPSRLKITLFSLIRNS